MARVGEEFPLECPACGGDIRLIAFITEPGPIRKILTHLGEPLEPPPSLPPEAHRPTGASSCRFMTTAKRFRCRPTSCPRSTSTASHRCRTQAAEAPGTATWGAVCADARKKTPPQGDARRFGEPPPDGRHAQSRCSRTVRQSEGRCGSAIDRAIARGSEPSRIHVRCADGECKFWLDPVALARTRGVPAHTVRDMERLVCEHVDLLLEQFDAHHPPGNRSRGYQSLD